MTMQTIIMANPKGFSHEATANSFFVANNPTPGTGIASKNASTARDPLVAIMNLYNAANKNSGENFVIIPVRLELRQAAVNTSGTAMNFDFYLDEIDRWSSGGTELSEVPTIISGESDFPAPESRARIDFGELVLAAASDEKLIHHELALSTIGAVGDIHDFWFADAPGSIDTGAATGHPDKTVTILPPVWIRPGASLCVHQYAASQTADPAFEVKLWYVEKPNAN